jgi:hypothetical protein
MDLHFSSIHYSCQYDCFAVIAGSDNNPHERATETALSPGDDAQGNQSNMIEKSGTGFSPSFLERTSCERLFFPQLKTVPVQVLRRNF